MFLFLVDLKVAAGNRKEFSQTMDAIVNQIRSQTECVKATLCQDIEDETSFILLTEWTARKDLENYIRSDRFGVLLGAGCLLEHPLSMEILPFPNVAGTEAVLAMRR